MQCNQCQQENPEGNTFCGHCGARLSANNAVSDNPESKLGIDTKGIVEETVKEIQKEAHFVQVQTVEAIQEKAINWAKVQIFILGGAIAILQASLIIWGVTALSDVHKEIDKKKEEFVKSRDDAIEKVDRSSKEAITSAEVAKQSSDNLNTKINQERDRLVIIQEEIKKTEENIIKGEINNLKNELKKAIAEARGNIAESKNIKTQAEKNRQAIEKIQNSFFEIFVHFEGNIEQKSKIIPDIIAKLNSEGFLVSGRNIAQVGVNITEILYYDQNAEAKVLFLKQLLKEWYEYTDIQTRLIPKDERNPKEILIKLRMP
jgi:hypothetical protein